MQIERYYTQKQKNARCSLLQRAFSRCLHVLVPSESERVFVHLQEGAENIGVIIENYITQNKITPMRFSFILLHFSILYNFYMMFEFSDTP